MMTMVRHLKYVTIVVGMSEMSGKDERQKPVLEEEDFTSMLERRRHEGREFFDGLKDFFDKAERRGVKVRKGFHLEGLFFVFERDFSGYGTTNYYKVFDVKKRFSRTLVFECDFTTHLNATEVDEFFALRKFLNGPWREKYTRAFLRNDELSAENDIIRQAKDEEATRKRYKDLGIEYNER